jgi:hypothetical protein
VGVCSCCPSITFVSDGPSMPGAGPLEIAAYGRNRSGKEIRVTLHVVDGRIDELEIWGGERDGIGKTDLPGAHTLVFD